MYPCTYSRSVCVCDTPRCQTMALCDCCPAQCVCGLQKSFFVLWTLTNFNFSTNSLFQKPLLLPSRYIAASFTPRRRPPWDFLGWRVSCPSWLLSPRRPHTRPRSFQSRLYSQCLHRPPRATWHWPIHRVALQWGDNSKKVSVSYCGYTLYCCCTAVVLLLSTYTWSRNTHLRKTSGSSPLCLWPSSLICPSPTTNVPCPPILVCVEE